ncbi:MAG TPA: secretin and TonB N-terminal domain-containing protein [Phycisphaerae bacterium]|jgi:type IV pilus assembly protein PilQ
MRNLKTAVSTGCFFLCLGGWVYSGQAIGADEATQAKDAALSGAVAGAAAPGATTPTVDAALPIRNTPMLAQAGGGEPAPVAPATTQGKPTDLSSAVVNVEVDGKVKQINMQDMDINTALYFFSLQTKKNIIASKNVKGTVTVNLYNVTFNEALDAMLRPNGFDYIEKGNFIYVYTVEEIAKIRAAERHAVNHIFHLKYMNAADVAILIKPMLSSTGQIAMTPAALAGVSSGDANPGGEAHALDDTIVVNDFPDNIAEVTEALKNLDVRPKQVLIEATVLNASLKDANGLGIDLVSLSGLNFSDIGSVISPLSGSASTGSTGSSSSTNVTTPGQVSGTLIPGVSNKQFDGGTNFANTVPSGGLSVGFLSNHISFFMRALETVTDTTVVANPKILALNKQKGEVHIGQKLGYLTTSTTTTTTQQTVEFLDIGTKLIFRPYITDDGYVRMDIHPEDSSGALDSRGVPQTNTTEVTSNLMIRDGRTIVIGGLFSENTSASKGQVPVLGNIPIFGVPFRSTNDSTTRQETIVLVTPHIINDDTSLYEESMKENEDVQRFMLGNRAGLQPWGRDRIAHMWYAKAQEEAAKGDKEKAIMYLDWCLNTNSRLLEAVRLREQLTNKKMDEQKGSSVADLVKDTLSGDAATTPDKGSGGNYPPPAPMTDKK